LSDRSSLQYRRLNEFFFQEQEEGSASENNETIQIGSLKLQRVHSSPNVYIIDDFLSASELGKRISVLSLSPHFLESYRVPVQCVFRLYHYFSLA
jgi:hypothetical protein